MRHTALPFVIAAILVGASASTDAQTDEIQVYTGGLAARGKFNLTLHSNYTPRGVETPAFEGGLTADKSFNGVPEWAYGVTDWFEAGLYLPLYSVDKNKGSTIDGMKLRALFAVPHADDRTFVYGVNFEFSINSESWDENRITSEVRPIIGWHLKGLDIFINPILDTSYDGLKNLDFAPAFRVAYNLPRMWAIAAEEYADYGPLHDFLPKGEQVHQLYGVVDKTVKGLDIEAGVGFGLTDATDKLTVKLILSHDLN